MAIAWSTRSANAMSMSILASRSVLDCISKQCPLLGTLLGYVLHLERLCGEGGLTPLSIEPATLRAFGGAALCTAGIVRFVGRETGTNTWCPGGCSHPRLVLGGASPRPSPLGGGRSRTLGGWGWFCEAVVPQGSGSRAGFLVPTTWPSFGQD